MLDKWTIEREENERRNSIKIIPYNIIYSRNRNNNNIKFQSRSNPFVALFKNNPAISSLFWCIQHNYITIVSHFRIQATYLIKCVCRRRPKPQRHSVLSPLESRSPLPCPPPGQSILWSAHSRRRRCAPWFSRPTKHLRRVFPEDALWVPGQA